MMLRMMIDKAPGATLTTTTTGGASLSQLADRNPGNPKGGVAAALEVLVTLPDTLTPINCLAVFGLSPEMEGGTIGVQRQAASPIGGHWGAGTYTADISSDRVWLPFDESGVDTGSAPYWKYWMITITPPSGATGSVGEVCLGLTEAPGINFNYGRGHAQTAPIIEHVTIGGVRWGYQMGAVERNSFELQWSQDIDEQQLANLAAFWQSTARSLYPFVLIPEDKDRMEGVYYCTMPQGLSNTQDFFDSFSQGLALTEVIAYESA